MFAKLFCVFSSAKALSLLHVADNLERAIDSVKIDQLDESEEGRAQVLLVAICLKKHLANTAVWSEDRPFCCDVSLCEVRLAWLQDRKTAIHSS